MITVLQESWKDIPEYEGYYKVSNYGNIKSLARFRKGKFSSSVFVKEKILKQCKDKDGYMICGLSKEGKLRNFRVHRLVADAFIPNPDNLPQVNHKDEDKANNFVWVNDDGSVDLEKSNLEWCTVEYNINYGSRTENATRIDNPNKCKCVLQYNLNGTLVKEWGSFAQINRKTGYDRKAIINCCKNKKHFNTAYGFKWGYKY